MCKEIQIAQSVCVEDQLTTQSMFHSTIISKNDQSLNFLASGSLAFKLYSQILLDKSLQGYTLQTLDCSSIDSNLWSGLKRNQMCFALVSDLGKEQIEHLCKYIMDVRVNSGFAIGEVLALDDDPGYIKSVKKMYSSFDEVIELNKFLMIDSLDMKPAEKITYLSTDLTWQLVRIILNASQLRHTAKAAATQSNPLITSSLKNSA